MFASMCNTEFVECVDNEPNENGIYRKRTWSRRKNTVSTEEHRARKNFSAISNTENRQMVHLKWRRTRWRTGPVLQPDRAQADGTQAAKTQIFRRRKKVVGIWQKEHRRCLTIEHADGHVHVHLYGKWIRCNILASIVWIKNAEHRRCKREADFGENRFAHMIYYRCRTGDM